jgi:regulator of sigma E protease
MFESFLYIILAILGLSFLIFIHELGHYYMARRVGMRVETFSIGFGKPIYSWMRDGVKWQIGWLLFGGYVKIAGMEGGEEQNPYEVKDGFFGKKPLDRILVAFMGPFVNIVFALLAFTLLWSAGGREKKFSDYTHKIGWVDPKSELYAKGVRPGDEITAYNQDGFKGAKDHLSVPMMSSDGIEVQGNHVDYVTGQKIPFDYAVKTYPHPAAGDKDVKTIGILSPASYIIYDKMPSGAENPLPDGSPMKNSGIEYGDRIVWVDGVQIFSNHELSRIINDPKTLLTIQSGNETFLRRVPRVLAEELKFDANFKEELIDWQFESQLNGTKIQKLYVVPYNLTNDGVVESSLKFIDAEKEEEAFPKLPFSSLDTPLKEGDKIVAVDGVPVNYSYEILAQLQQHLVNIIVERDPKVNAAGSWTDEDKIFDTQFNLKDLEKLALSIGTSTSAQSEGNLVKLNVIQPKMYKDFDFSPEKKALLATEIQAKKKEIEGISDPEKKSQALHALENFENQLVLGLPLIQDKRVSYNPNAFTLFGQVFEEIWTTLKALFSGSLNPKWLSGPIGIVQVVHDTSMVSIKEALFWLGAISMNLGVLNLLPLPVLDGGTICFSLYELLTRRRLKAKTMEKLVIPFALLLIGFFIYLTYHDLARLFKNFF